MTETLFLLNVTLAGFLLAQGLWKRAGYLEVPFLSALIYLIWYLPQAFVLLDDMTLPQGSLARVLAMSLLCLLAIWYGWRTGFGSVEPSRQELTVPLDRLFWPTLLLTVFAIAMRLILLAQPDEARAASQWSGTITIIAFFSRVSIVSFVFSLAMVLHKRYALTITLLVLNTALYVAPLLIYFRRADTFEFILAGLLCVYFFLKRTIPKIAIIAGLIVGYAYINGVGHLRDLGGGYKLSATGEIETRVPTFEELSEIDWFGFEEIESAKLRSEVRNAAIYMAVSEANEYATLGAELWNQLIHSYIPAQILGADFKQSLIIGQSLIVLSEKHEAFSTFTGTTSTGFVSPYRDFWFFGVAVFYFVTRFLGQQYAKAYSGSLKSLSLYAILLPLAVQSLTHSGYYVIIHAPLPLGAAWLAWWSARLDRNAPRTLQGRGFQAVLTSK
jgi:hypothetical protein